MTRSNCPLPGAQRQLLGENAASSAILDRLRKTDISHLEVEQVLQSLARMPVSTWRFNTDSPEVRYAGPIAQDSHPAFGLGESDTPITAAEISGIALAAIQGLHQEPQSKEARIAAPQDQIEEH